VEIDVYSQGRNPKLKLPGPNKSARNMGKNDLWIAATASPFNLRLITTDGDSEHLAPHFLRLSQFPLPLL
jgi:tRNA(fMet)-specific endonuclease VapC